MTQATIPNSSGESTIRRFSERARRFWSKPARDKWAFLFRCLWKVFPNLPVPLRLPFGAWWLVRGSALDDHLLRRSFEEAELQFVRRFLQPGMAVLDVGAHHGLYTLLASRRVGRDGRVVAFEPSTRERRRLQQHVHLNRCSNVRIEPFALGRQRSQAELFLVEGSEDWCNSLRPPAVGARTQTVRVDVIRLDEYLVSARIPKVDFLKVDVEGAECEVLKGAARLLTVLPRPVILIEVEDKRTQPWGYEAREIVIALDRARYECFRALPDGSLVEIGTKRDGFDANLVAIPRERREEVLSLLDQLC